MGHSCLSKITSSSISHCIVANRKKSGAQYCKWEAEKGKEQMGEEDSFLKCLCTFSITLFSSVMQTEPEIIN
jgi:hypothetical protein